MLVTGSSALQDYEKLRIQYKRSGLSTHHIALIYGFEQIILKEIPTLDKKELRSNLIHISLDLLFRELEIICWASLNMEDLVRSNNGDLIFERLQMTAYAIKLTMGNPRSSFAVTAHLEEKIPDFKLLFVGWAGRCLATNREQFETSHFTP